MQPALSTENRPKATHIESLDGLRGLGSVALSFGVAWVFWYVVERLSMV